MKHDRKGKRVSIGACNSKRRTTRNRFVGSVAVIVRVVRGTLFAIDTLSRCVIWLLRIIRYATQHATRHLSRAERSMDLIRMENRSISNREEKSEDDFVYRMNNNGLSKRYLYLLASVSHSPCGPNRLDSHFNGVSQWGCDLSNGSERLNTEVTKL